MAHQKTARVKRKNGKGNGTAPRRGRKRARSNGELPKLRRFGKIEFWADYHHRRSAVVVECDDPNYPVIKVYAFKSKTEGEACLERANKLVERIRAQEVDYRKMALTIPKWAQWSRDYMSLLTKSGLVEREGV